MLVNATPKPGFKTLVVVGTVMSARKARATAHGRRFLWMFIFARFSMGVWVSDRRGFARFSVGV